MIQHRLIVKVVCGGHHHLRFFTLVCYSVPLERRVILYTDKRQQLLYGLDNAILKVAAFIVHRLIGRSYLRCRFLCGGQLYHIDYLEVSIQIRFKAV